MPAPSLYGQLSPGKTTMQTGGVSPYPNLTFQGHVDWQHVNPVLLAKLDQLAQQHKVTIDVFSGYRSDDYSAKVGGFSGDPHSKGIAVDANIGDTPIGDVPGWSDILASAGLRSGTTFIYHGKPDPSHVDLVGMATAGMPSTPSATAPAPANPRSQMAQLIYGLAVQAGLPPNRAQEMIAAADAESGLDPNNVNPSSGAAGLFQLLSSGYRQKAESLGGLHDPSANTRAILPDYVAYWQKHPNAAPGEAGRDVEASGMGADFYTAKLGEVPALLGAQTEPNQPTPNQPTPNQPSVVSPAESVSEPPSATVLPQPVLPPPTQAGLPGGLPDSGLPGGVPGQFMDDQTRADMWERIAAQPGASAESRMFAQNARLVAGR